MKLLTIVLGSVVVLLVAVLLWTTKSQPTIPPPAMSADNTPVPKSIGPIFNSVSSLPSLTATAVEIIDLESGKDLYSKNADILVAPASTTKIMTALTAIDVLHLDDVITVKIPKVDGQKMHLVNGERISVESIFYGLLVFSANDAAEQISRIYPGGRATFILAMNKKAKDLGLKDSKFQNPSGLDQVGHVTTAYEMAMLGKALMENPVLKQIVGTKDASVTSVDAKITHKLSSTNELLARVPGVLGIKTGWTEEARENLVTYIDRGHPVIISLFGSDDRFGETKKLIDWVYQNYTW